MSDWATNDSTLLRAADQMGELMKPLNLLAAASALSLCAVPFAMSPASAQGKSETAPGQQQMKPGSAKTYAPGQVKPEGESAREFAPGQQQPEENSGRSSTVEPVNPQKPAKKTY
jgi:hypothetical protein